MASFPSVFPAYQVVYCPGKAIERLVYRFYEITMEKVCQWEGNLSHFQDQVAYSYQNHEMTRQTNHSDWKNENTDSPPDPPDTKSAKQSDENISRLESFKKGKEKLIGERQKVFWREMQGFVSAIGHHESRRLHENCARQIAQTSWIRMTSCAWRSDSTQCLTIAFQRLAHGIKVSNRNTASEIYSEFMYLCWRLWSPCFSLYFAKEKQLLIKIKFIYRAMHACIEFKFKISDRNLFPDFWQPKFISQAQLTSSSTVRGKNYAQVFKKFLNLNLKRNRSRRQSFAVQKIKSFNLIWRPPSRPVFPWKFPCVCWAKRRSCYWYFSQCKAKLFIKIVVARVPSSLVPA